MKTQKMIAIAALALVCMAGYKMYNKKNPTTTKSKNYANAAGKILKLKSQNCAVCRDTDGNNYHTGNDRNCNRGDTCVTRYSYEQQQQIA